MQRETLLQVVAEASARRDGRMAARPGERRARGVVHTPPPLARYVAAAADRALSTRLGLRLGLADPRVTLLDPAVGTGAFLAACFDVTAGRPGAPAASVGYDVDALALEACEAALGEAFRARGWPLSLVRADTLSAPPGPRAEVAVVIGNPPWAARSGAGARGPSDALLEDFRRDEGGARLDERKLGVLSDDYVRFFRLAAEEVRRARGGGLVALVTNASYLDGPVHRAMRSCLLRWFAWVDVLDLGGSALIARAEARDENVFGVRPGVAVTLAGRPPGHGELVPGAELRYARLRGGRASKLEALLTLEPGERLAPTAPLYRFVPGAERVFPEGALPLPALFPFHREGVQTNRDEVVVDAERGALLARLGAFARGAATRELEPALRALPHYDPARARAAVARALEADPDGARGESARPLAYRPFEPRWFAPIAPLCHRPRPALLEAVARSELVLLTVRKDRGERGWRHVAASREVPDNCFLSSRSSCRTRAFPTHDPSGAENLDRGAAAALFARAGRAVSALDAAHYALGLLAAEGYRARYEAALLRDYPRLLPPPSPEAFEALRAAGAALAEVFLRPADLVDNDLGLEIGHARPARIPARLPAALAAASSAFEALDPR
jgi:hypothetical protein